MRELRDPPGGQRAPLLHNMSCRPDATVQHTGTHHGRALRFGFALSADRSPRLSDVQLALGLRRKRGETLLDQLERIAAEPCPLLAQLPAVAAVHGVAAGEVVPGLTDQPLLILAVLTRSSGNLFLRDRPPAVTQDRVLRSITLLAPANWTLKP